MVFPQCRVSVHGPRSTLRAPRIASLHNVFFLQCRPDLVVCFSAPRRPKLRGADKLATWFLDSYYDRRTFCVIQAFFPDQSAWDKRARALGDVVDAAAFAAYSGTVSLPFAAGQHRRVAVKVIDLRGNEVMQTHILK